MRYLALRFDVDTHKCIKEGTPNLIEIGQKHRKKFTFYVNMGRSVSIYSTLKGLVEPKSAINSDKMPSCLPAMEKLGFYNYLYAAIVNPVLSDYGSEEILRITKLGHEIGLHGGRNHELWNREIDQWSEAHIRSEIEWGVNRLKTLGIKNFPGFASPHWKGNGSLQKVLKEFGFKYLSNTHGVKKVGVVSGVIDSVSVNISGEPGGVGYFEYCQAIGLSDEQTIDDLFSRVKRSTYSIVYDHPYYAGVAKINLIDKVLFYAKKNDVEIVTVDQIRRRIKQ
jgi:peptidoglycan/xylan/chitin deacetylase (PgdA/CDA1 family)